MARASSRGGKRLAALPGTSIPLNEFDQDNHEMDAPLQEEEEKREDGFEESPQMEPRGTHQEDQDAHHDEENEGSPEFIDGGVIVADEIPERDNIEQLREDNLDQDTPE